MIVCAHCGCQNIDSSLSCDACGKALQRPRAAAPPPPEELAYLVETQSGTRFRIRSGAVVGRRGDAGGVSLASLPESQSIRDSHARFRKRGDHWYVSSLDRASLVHIDGDEVVLGDEARLRPRSDIRLGTLHFRIASGDSPQAQPPQPAPAAEPKRRVLGDKLPGEELPHGHIVVETLQAHGADRTGVFLADSASGERVVVKIWPADHPPDPQTIEELRKLKHPNIVAILDVFEDKPHWYEVAEYCSRGTLEQFIRPGGVKGKTLRWLVARVIPELNEAIAYVHSKGLIHRDIKPKNILLRRDASVALTDFGIARRLSSNETSRNTAYAAATWEYAAPEAFPSFDEDEQKGQTRLNRPQDYYSFGMTLLALLQGATPLSKSSYAQIDKFYRDGKVVALPANPPERLDALLRGLLIRDVGLRWGYEEVNRWSRNANTDGDLEKLRHFGDVRPAAGWEYKLKDVVVRSLPQLAAAMLNDETEATKRLFSPELLINQVAAADANVAAGMAEDVRKYAATVEQAFWCAIVRIDPQVAFRLPNGESVNDPYAVGRKLRELTAAKRVAEEEVALPEVLERFAIWLERRKPAMIDLAARVRAIPKNPPKPRLSELIWMLDGKVPYTVVDGVTATLPKEIAAAVYGQAGGWARGVPTHYSDAAARIRAGYLSAYLRQRNCADLAKRCDEQLKAFGSGYAAIEQILRLLDPSLTKVVVEIDVAKFGSQLRWGVSYGQDARLTVPYRTVGPGVPFGTVRVTGQSDAVTVAESTIKEREGTLALDFVGAGKHAVGKYKLALQLQSNFTDMRPKR